MASLGVFYIVFIQRHGYPLTPRFYWVPSSIFSVMDDSSSLYVGLWAAKPFHFLASMAYGNFLLGEEMIVPACEDYRLCRGWEQVTGLLVEGILLERPMCSSCFSPWSILFTFAVSPTLLHHQTLGKSKLPCSQEKTGALWTAISYWSMGFSFDEGLDAPGPGWCCRGRVSLYKFLESLWTWTSRRERESGRI